MIVNFLQTFYHDCTSNLFLWALSSTRQQPREIMLLFWYNSPLVNFQASRILCKRLHPGPLQSLLHGCFSHSQVVLMFQLCIDSKFSCLVPPSVAIATTPHVLHSEPGCCIHFPVGWSADIINSGGVEIHFCSVNFSSLMYLPYAFVFSFSRSQ